MSLLLSSFLWAQQGPAGGGTIPNWLQWLYVWGDPSLTITGLWGGVVTWIKVIGLFCLLGWVMSWVVAAVKASNQARLRPLDIAALVALLGAIGSVLLRSLQTGGRLPEWDLGGMPAAGILALLCILMILIWIEVKLWSSIRRLGTGADLVVLGAIHIALVVGFAVSFGLQFAAAQLNPQYQMSVQDALFTGGRIGATYMGFVVLARVVAMLIPEFAALHFRRLYAIAWHCWKESFRRMWAPWVVIVVFAVILAFTSWFLKPPRAAELGRLYVGTLMLLCSLLMTVLVAILTPISLPNDIRQQTIYTIVSKPVRRLELIWGRMLGFMSLVTVLLLLFGGVSLLYFHRMVGGEIRDAREQAAKFKEEGKEEFYKQYQEQADQLETRMSARVPVKGSLLFYDSRGKRTVKGIDVGQELEFRSFVEGATPSKAVWRFGPRVEDPRNPRAHPGASDPGR